MRLNRFLDNFNLDDDRVIISNKESVHQIKNVLRLSRGDTFIICDGNNNEAKTKIDKIGSSTIEIVICERFKNSNEAQTRIVLYCSILKRANFELVAQKATEVGVSEIIPLRTKRTVKQNIKIDRLNKIIKEAAEQSGRGTLPELHSSIEFKHLRNYVRNYDRNYVFHNSGKIFKYKNNSLKKIALYIGPEGGWDESELEYFKKNSYDIISLGKLTLRAETAAIIASYFFAT